MFIRMDLRDTPEQAAFRAEVRAWIAEHRHEAPPMAGGMHADEPKPFRAWQSKLASAGLVGVTWPKEYGGAGLTPIEEVIVSAELRKAGCPGIVDHIAVGDCGPTIIAFGTDAQKERHLAPLLHGDEGWCQLFSEPAAGSDLAGIQTRAKRTADGWVVNGQKVWTTLAQFADWGLLLARTNPDVPKHRGLSMFLIDMHAPGVTVRPLRGISGESHFNEVFFDDVQLPADALIGPEDAGWSVAMTTLMFERMTLLAAFEQLGWSAESTVAPMLGHPRLADTDVRQRIAEVTCDLLSMRYAGYRALTALARGEIPGLESGLGKIGLIEAGRKGAALQAEVLGPDALLGEAGTLAAEMPGLRSGGGTNEILANTLGERVLGLPAEPRVDKDVPFSELSTNGASRAEVTLS
jgi:alkylation response protein AidB-like acyl-CoA dehydrogenase